MKLSRANRLRARAGRTLDFVIIGVLLAVIAVMAFRHYRPWQASGENASQKSIAILPFIDLSPMKEQDYFSDGITEQIINSLGHVHGLLVVARTTAFSFKNKEMDVREVGRQLQVTHMLEGSVNRSTDKVRVVARLIDVANGFHLWSETYYSTEKDLLSLQSDVARKVASALRIELRLAETKQLAKPPTHDPEAYDLYLRGRYLLNKRTADSIQKGRLLFEQAVAKRSSLRAWDMRESPIPTSYLAKRAQYPRKRPPPERGRRFQSTLGNRRESGRGLHFPGDPSGRFRLELASRRSGLPEGACVKFQQRNCPSLVRAISRAAWPFR